MMRETTESNQAASLENYAGPWLSVAGYPLSAIRHRASRYGFTLVELLVVIAIIGLLAGLLLPAVIGGVKKGDVARAQTEAKLIETAMAGYLNEYGKFPGQNNDANDYTYGPNDYLMLVATLRGSNASGTANNFMGQGNPWGNQNPRAKVFLSISDAHIVTNNPGGGAYAAQQGELADPWGNRYNVVADWTMDGKVTPQLADDERVTNGVAVWSWGTDVSCQADDKSKAHIRSWR